MLDSPRTENAFAAALPLEGLDAWRVYLGLPLTGSRLPAGGIDALMRLGNEDAVLNLHGPITAQATEEFEAAFAELRTRLDLGDGPVGVLGGSLGAAVAQLVLAQSSVTINAAVLVSPLVQLRPVIDALAQRYGFVYPWSDSSLEVARRLDFVARAEEIAQRGQPPVLLVIGKEDDPEGFHMPAKRLHAALAAQYTDLTRTRLVMVPDMAHALAEEPGTEPAPQTPHAAEVDRHAVTWLRRHLAPS
jgi:alpha-beta hydrolase superfamily lysophospholipase